MSKFPQKKVTPKWTQKENQKKALENYLEAKQKQQFEIKASTSVNNNKIIINALSWQLVMSYCSLSEIARIFAASKCFIIMSKDMEAAIFKSGFINSVNRNHNLAGISSIFRNKVMKYAKPTYDCLCGCNLGSYRCCHKFVDIHRHDICDMFIKYVKEDNVPQIKFILNIYGVYMHRIDNYMPAFVLSCSSKPDLSFEIFQKLVEICKVQHGELYHTSIFNPFIIIPFVLKKERITRTVLKWIRNVNDCVLKKRISRYHSIVRYGDKIEFDTGVISVGHNCYGNFSQIIKNYNDANGWNLYELYTKVIDESIGVYVKIRGDAT